MNLLLYILLCLSLFQIHFILMFFVCLFVDLFCFEMISHEVVELKSVSVEEASVIAGSETKALGKPASFRVGVFPWENSSMSL